MRFSRVSPLCARSACCPSGPTIIGRVGRAPCSWPHTTARLALHSLPNCRDPGHTSEAQHGDADAVRQLIAEGVDPSFANDIGQTALHVACVWGTQGCVEVLIQAGAKLDAVNSITGDTPLHLAAQDGDRGDPGGRAASVKLLVAAGASTNIKNKKGRKAYQGCSDPELRVLLGGPADVHDNNPHGGGGIMGSQVVLSAEAAPYIEMETSLGTFVLELYWSYAPMTCQNFASLSARGYYNGVKFHRVVPGFMIQGGDPTGTGKGGESIFGAQFKDECHAELGHRGAGVLSMANTGPNTNSSQFFITLAPIPWLDGGHTIFGRVARGVTVVKRMGEAPTRTYTREYAMHTHPRALCVVRARTRTPITHARAHTHAYAHAHGAHVPKETRAATSAGCRKHTDAIDTNGHIILRASGDRRRRPAEEGPDHSTQRANRRSPAAAARTPDCHVLRRRRPPDSGARGTSISTAAGPQGWRYARNRCVTLFFWPLPEYGPDSTLYHSVLGVRP